MKPNAHIMKLVNPALQAISSKRHLKSIEVQNKKTTAFVNFIKKLPLNRADRKTRKISYQGSTMGRKIATMSI